jgi:pantoate--beta-alanine ligase
MKVVRTVAEARAALADLTRPLGLVPTMGAFHEGHLSLMRTARERCATVAVSLFVNPTQFRDEEDLERYPRDEARDLEAAEEADVDLLFAPAAETMYGPHAATTVSVGGPLTERHEAAERPGYLDGVATVVTKLCSITTPDLAFFGRKDAQQLAVIRRLCDDLDLPVEIVAIDTLREPDGLAMSSRNAALSEAQRTKAADLFRALQAGRSVAAVGRKAVIDEVTAKLVLGFPPYLHEAPLDGPAGPLFSIDYVDVVDPDTFEQIELPVADSLIIVAARLGETRLIDNLPVGEPTEHDDAEAATDETARTTEREG